MYRFPVLIADDDATARVRLSHLLDQFGYRVVVCNDGAEAWRAIHRPDAPHLLLLDWMMPGMDGVEIIRRLRGEEDAQSGYFYTLLLSARDDPEDVVAGLEAGADDYLIKPCHKAELQVRLRAGRRILALQQQLLDARDRLAREAKTDALTGVDNRREIERMLRHELDRAWREGRPLALAMLDIDFFKKVNDTYGHLAGDEVLRETARRLRGCLRSYDRIGRYGGEEFLLLFPGDDAGDARQLAERLRSSVAAAPVDSSAGVIPVTVSIGVCALPAGVACEPQRLIDAADRMLYRAKEGGRNRVEVTRLEEEARQGCAAAAEG
ncbi:MAG: diguanylate cyclase [Zetaproteobacteria bacterium]|nr:MAG: diguanylate cyclase [Zetaproteobacteria bacterium]